LALVGRHAGWSRGFELELVLVLELVLGLEPLRGGDPLGVCLG
jgi:hypothetical protein